MIYSDNYWEDVKRVCRYIPQIEKLNHKRIFITGATGMICSSVVEILAYLNQEHNAGIELILAGRNKPKLDERFNKYFEYQFVFYDAVKSFQTDENVDYIIHGAGNANPAVYATQPVETLFGNVMGTNSLLNFANRVKARLLYLSSSEVYGQFENNECYKECDYGFVDILNPRACYPNGKRASETLCAAYAAEYAVDTVIVRPGHIYGPSIMENDTRAFAQFIRNALRGENIVMKSSGMQLRSYCYTLDCASAILTVLLNGEETTAYNISNKNSVVTIRNLAETLAKYAGVKVVFEMASDFEKKGYNLMSHSDLDASKIEKLGWSAAFDLEEGVQRSIEMMRI